MKGKWDRWYTGLEADKPEPYGDTTTYDIAADFLADCLTVEDWGCGKGYFSTRIQRDRYVGIDGTKSPFANIVTDLRRYTSHSEGVLLRHVLEHNKDWKKILHNASVSAIRRLCIILFTPLADETHQIGWTAELQVPDISFAINDIYDELPGWFCTHHTLVTNTQYGEETVIKGVRG